MLKNSIVRRNEASRLVSLKTVSICLMVLSVALFSGCDLLMPGIGYDADLYSDGMVEYEPEVTNYDLNKIDPDHISFTSFSTCEEVAEYINDSVFYEEEEK